MFRVVLHGRKKDEKPQYFTPQNEIVDDRGMYYWTDYTAACNAAKRARLQDPLNRHVTVEET